MINSDGEFVQRYGRPEFNMPAGAGDSNDYFTEDEHPHPGVFCEVCQKNVYFMWLHKQEHEKEFAEIWRAA